MTSARAILVTIPPALTVLDRSGLSRYHSHVFVAQTTGSDVRSERLAEVAVPPARPRPGRIPRRTGCPRRLVPAGAARCADRRRRARLPFRSDGDGVPQGGLL